MNMALKLSNRVKNPLLVLAILVILVSLVLIYGKNPGVNLPQKSAGETAQGVETPKENSAEAYSDFHNAYNNIPASYGDLENTKKLFDINDKIYGGIVSHHFLMAPEIAEFFAGFKDQRIETVVILGPNHFSRGEADIQISKYPYNTPWGVLEPNSEIIGKLLQNDFVSNEEATFNKEHSISTLAGFAKYFLPNAKIVPIVLKRKTTAMEAEKLAKAL